MSEGSQSSVIEDLLRANTYFLNQSESFFTEFASILTRRELSDGEVILNEGKHVDYMFILEKGALERTLMKPDGEESENMVVDSVMQKGRAIGLLHLLTKDGDLAYATVRATGPATVWYIYRSDFHSFILSVPEYTLALMASMAKELRTSSKIRRALDRESRGFTGIHILCYDTASWVRTNFTKGIAAYNETAPDDQKMIVNFTTDTLSAATASSSVHHTVACLFVNDTADKSSLLAMSNAGVQMIAMRCAGFDRVDIDTAKTLGMTVARVPAYSPYAVAEHGIALLMALNRKLYKAIPRVDDFNFMLDGLMGFDLHGKTVGVIGTGKIGICLCNILLGFGVNLICYDIYSNEDLIQRGAKYQELDYIWNNSDVIFLMTPLFPSTHHIFNKAVLPKLKKGMYLINTSRGGLIETEALISGIKSGIVGGAALDVYENEAGYFFRDFSDTVLADDLLSQLLSFHNVILTAHQAFFTQEAVDKIVSTTIENIKLFMNGITGKSHPNSVY